MTKLISIISLAIIITMCLFGSMPADAIDGKIASIYQSPSVTFSNDDAGLKENQAKSNNEIQPVFRAKAVYPKMSRWYGEEGWVKLAFDIDETGKVVNVSVIDYEPGRPGRRFVRAARKALQNWKYQVRLVDGKPVVQKDNKVQLNFKMEAQR